MSKPNKKQTAFIDQEETDQQEDVKQEIQNMQEIQKVDHAGQEQEKPALISELLEAAAAMGYYPKTTVKGFTDQKFAEVCKNKFITHCFPFIEEDNDDINDDRFTIHVHLNETGL